MSDITQRLGFGPLEGLPTFWSSAALTTTALQVTIARVTAGQAQAAGVKIRIKNGHASNFLAYAIIPRVSPFVAPTITADFVNATCAAVVGPGETEIFASVQLAHGSTDATGAILGAFDLVVVGSAASTTVNVTSFLYR